MIWHVSRRFASVTDPRPGLDEYLDENGGWTSEKTAARSFGSEQDAWTACRLVQDAYPKTGSMPAFGIGRS
jgi:hypothetical protein